MRGNELVRLSFGAVRAQRMRSFLTALGIGIGVAAVVLLTSIGEGIQRFVLAEFTQFGTNLISVAPGRTTTHGASVGVFGTTRPLTLEDAQSLARVPQVVAVEPIVAGNAQVEAERRRRRTNVYGVGPQFPRVFTFEVAFGRFLPPDEPRGARAFAVLGNRLWHELYGETNPLGQRIRVGGDRYRVIGVMEPKGQVLGFDIDDTVYIPAAKALELFNREGLVEIDVLYQAGTDPDHVAEGVRRLLIARHGREDFTITTQKQMLEVLGSVLDVVTFAVGALGGISLLVGAVGILTIMTIAVRERTAEIGLLRALGAPRRLVLALFLAEATLLAAVGGAAGLALGLGTGQALTRLVPALPVHVNWGFAVAAELLSVAIGLAAGALPARHAASLDPVEALRTE